jgi:hypothetical protein
LGYVILGQDNALLWIKSLIWERTHCAGWLATAVASQDDTDSLVDAVTKSILVYLHDTRNCKRGSLSVGSYPYRLPSKFKLEMAIAAT